MLTASYALQNARDLAKRAGTQDSYISIPLVVVISCFLAILSTTSQLISIALLCLSIWALTGVKQAIQALSLASVIKFLNPAVYTLPDETTVLGWLVMSCAGLRFLSKFHPRQLAIVTPLIVFSLVAASLSFYDSTTDDDRIISIFKIASFTYVAATVLIGFSTVGRSTLEQLKTWFCSMGAAIVLLSLPTLFFPEVGYLRNGTGFQGLLNHPQAFGIFLAPMIAWMTGDLLFCKQHRGRLQFALLVVLYGMMVLSLSRTAILSVVLSIAAMLYFVRTRRTIPILSSSRAALLISASCLFIAACLVLFTAMSEEITSFLLKGGEDGIEESFYLSRGMAVETLWQRFLERPLTGHGFGVLPLWDTWDKMRELTYFMGFPISAPVEKGFLPAAVLEEIGIVGTVFFLYLVVTLAKAVLKNPDAGLICLFFSCLFVNLGEAVFFSAGGIGAYFWLLIGLATASGWRRTHAA